MTIPTLSENSITSIGNTPLIKIESLSKDTKRNIYFKAEYINPGGSIKDRACLYMLEDAFASGKLQAGGTIVEATAGNTGIALAMLAKTYDPPFKVRLYVVETLVHEKLEILEMLGATVVKCPIVKPSNPFYINNQAKMYAAQNKNAFHVNQFDNLSNRRSHFQTTGPEIWEQTKHNIDAFVCGCGTGGTFSGVSEFLRSKNPSVKIFCCDNEGSGLYSYIISNGMSWHSEGKPFVEGIGRLEMCANMNDLLTLADGCVRVVNIDVIKTIYSLVHRDGLRVGGSGGLNIFAAKKLAMDMPEGSTIVTTVADSADRYSSKIFNKIWLIDNGYWSCIPEDLQYLAE